MRTTLTIDDDVANQLERYRREHGETMKEVVNEGLRRGLRAMNEPLPARRASRTREVSLGRCFLPSIDDVSEALAIAEGEAFR